MMSRSTPGFCLLAFLLLGACRTNGPRVTSETKDIEFARGEGERGKLAQMALVYQGIEAPSLKSEEEVKSGPLPESGKASRDHFRWGQEVTCIFSDDNFEEGATRGSHFLCDLIDKDQNILAKATRISYGAQNAQVYHSIVASRLLWLLGYPSAASYAVKIRCLGCPSLTDPLRYLHKYDAATLDEKQAMRESIVALRKRNAILHIDPAVIEKDWAEPLDLDPTPAPWTSYDELNADPKSWKFSAEEIEGETVRRQSLLLLAGLIQHIEVSRHQPQIFCRKLVDKGNCAPQSAWLLLTRLGLSFGAEPHAADERSSTQEKTQNAAALNAWKNAKTPFTSAGSCEFNLTTLDADGITLSTQRVKSNEAARRFLVSRFVALGGGLDDDLRSDVKAALRSQLDKVFTAGRSGELYPKKKWWIDAMMEKIEGLANYAGCRS